MQDAGTMTFDGIFLEFWNLEVKLAISVFHFAPLCKLKTVGDLHKS